jgi:hypothetical protein
MGFALDPLGTTKTPCFRYNPTTLTSIPVSAHGTLRDLYMYIIIKGSMTGYVNLRSVRGRRLCKVTNFQLGSQSPKFI